MFEEHGWTKETATAENIGYVDVRCDEHQTEYGSYKENEQEFVKNKLGTPQEYEEFAKTKPTKDHVTQEVLNKDSKK